MLNYTGSLNYASFRGPLARLLLIIGIWVVGLPLGVVTEPYKFG